jgi:hypothetical protein
LVRVLCTHQRDWKFMVCAVLRASARLLEDYHGQEEQTVLQPLLAWADLLRRRVEPWQLD